MISHRAQKFGVDCDVTCSVVTVPLGSPIRSVNTLPPHGTRARYVAGCDCPTCLLAEAEYHALRRGGRCRLAVQCGCERHDVWMPPEDVRNGVMPVCGRCKEDR